MNFLDLDPRRSGCTDPRRGLAVLHLPSSTPSPECPVALPARVDTLAGNAASSTRPVIGFCWDDPLGWARGACRARRLIRDQRFLSRRPWAVAPQPVGSVRARWRGPRWCAASARLSAARRIAGPQRPGRPGRPGRRDLAGRRAPLRQGSNGWAGPGSAAAGGHRPDERTRSAGRRPPMLPGVCLGRGVLRLWQSGCRSR